MLGLSTLLPATSQDGTSLPPAATAELIARMIAAAPRFGVEFVAANSQTPPTDASASPPLLP